MVSLQMDVPETQIEKTLEVSTQAPVPAQAKPADTKPQGGHENRGQNAVLHSYIKNNCAAPKILRFAKSERHVHWAIAGPFLISLASALVLVTCYNADPSRPYRIVFATIHRVSGILLIFLPMLAILKSRGDIRIYFYNIKQAWTWVWDDVKWLALQGRAALNPNLELPEQGKFNAGEKLNFMMLMTTYPLYVITGLLMWVTHLAVLSWIMHFTMALMAVPLIGGHLFMALINPHTRKGLEGMTTGYVDREWAKHHYRRWYREHYEKIEQEPPLNETSVADPEPSGVAAEQQDAC